MMRSLIENELAKWLSSEADRDAFNLMVDSVTAAANLGALRILSANRDEFFDKYAPTDSYQRGVEDGMAYALNHLSEEFK